MTRLALGIATAAAATALTGCGGSTSTADKPSATPTSPTSAPAASSTPTAYAVVLFQDALGATDPSGASHCDDRAGNHADVYTGAQIQLVDATGATVGSDTLKVATGADAPPKNV